MDRSAITQLATSRSIPRALSRLVDMETWRLHPECIGEGNHAWYIVGELFWRQGKYGEALNAYRRGLRLWPSDVDAMWAIGNCYAELGKYKLAERFFLRVIAIKPTNKDVLYNLANCLFDQGRLDDAEKLYKRVIRGKGHVAVLARKNLAALRRNGA